MVKWKKFRIAAVGLIGIFLLALLLYHYLNSYTPPINKNSAQTEAERLFSKCHSTTLKDTCYSNGFAGLTQQHNTQFALNILTSLQDIEPSTRDCHLIAHAIAHAETNKDVSKWQQVLSEADPALCNGGFVHGVLEVKALSDPTFAINEKTIPAICNSAKQEKQVLMETVCIHILGHLILTDKVGKIPEAVAVCTKLPSTKSFDFHNDQLSCLTGLFMESITRDNLVAHGLASHIDFNQKTSSEEENICRQYTGLTAHACWQEVGRMYGAMFKDNPQMVYDNCNKAANQQDTQDCYIHAMQLMSVTDNLSFDKLNLFCRSFLSDKDSGQFLNCIKMVNYFLLGNSVKFADRAIYLCTNTVDYFKQACFSSFGDDLKQLATASDKQKFCSDVPKQYKTNCLNGFQI